MNKCIYCGSELTTGDYNGVCSICRNAGFDVWRPPQVIDTEKMIPIMYGWVCPRCGAVHSPYKYSCDCTPPMITDTQLTIDFDGSKYSCSTTLGRSSESP